MAFINEEKKATKYTISLNIFMRNIVYTFIYRLKLLQPKLVKIIAIYFFKKSSQIKGYQETEFQNYKIIV